MSTPDRGGGPDEPDASKSIEEESIGKSIEDKQPLNSASMSKRNETTPNGSKRKRKDWRAFASENGGVRRRFLRSDTTKLLAEAEAEARSARGAGTRFSPAELEGMDWVKCGDDLQIANGNAGKLNEKVSKWSNEHDVSLTTSEEVTNIGETEHLGNGKLGASERKEGDDASSGIGEGDLPFENKVKQVIDTKEKEAMSETEILKPTDIEGKSMVEAEDTENEHEQVNVVKGDKKKVPAAVKKIPIQVETSKHCPKSRGKTQKTSASKKGQKITLKSEAGPTDLVTVKAEVMEAGDNQFNIIKKDKKKPLAANKRTRVHIEPVTVEKRITRSSAAKQKVNDENAAEIDGTTKVEGQVEEENSGLDQTDAVDNELSENFRLRKNKKKIPNRRKSLDLTDSDEDFNPVRKRVRKKQVKPESDMDDSVSSGSKQKLPMERKKLKMNKQNSNEEPKAVRLRDRSKKLDVEREKSDSSGYYMERRAKKKEPKMERDDSGSDSDFMGSNEAMPSMKKSKGQLPGSKQRTDKTKFSKMTTKKKKRQSKSKNKEVIKVESLSELDDKPPKIAKGIVSGMIKDLLKQHGWKIEMRPRISREYFDQVHVAPDGTTHWSITKAYYAFLKSEHVTEFTPIPEELLGVLKKNVSKTRCDAKKKRKLKGMKKGKGKWLGVNSKKIKKKGKLKKKIKNEVEQSVSSGINEMDVNLSSISKRLTPGRGRKKKARLTLLARQSHKEGDTSDENDYVPYEWKRTVFSWMIDLDVVPENGKVKYIDPKKPDPLAEGKISREGIECNCCGKSFTVSDFAVHAGAENSCSCLSDLFVEDVGLHFLQCLVRAWEKQCSISEPKGFFLSAEGDGVDQNDDTCGVCGDGGALVCCDKCPSTFHLGCLGMEMLPSGDWHCPYCSCAFCMKLSSCPLLSCNQCNGKFHSSCVSKKDQAFAGQGDSISFCGESCKKLFDGLEAILGVNHKLEGGFSWRLVRHITDDESSMDPVHKPEVRALCNAKIAVAMAVMEECFLPIDDERSGIDLLQNVVYSCKSNFVRLNFRSFYTFLLERDDEVICVASVRVHGIKLTEMPFIGTRYMYRRQGMCRRLLDGIESALSSLKVQKLIIPAITELVDTWTKVFGFRPLEGLERQELRSKSIVVFPGTGLLQKPMLTSSKEDCDTGNEKILESPRNQQCSNGDMSPELVDASCADMKPDNSGEGSSYATATGEGDLAGPSETDADVVQSVEHCGGFAEPDDNTLQDGGKCEGLVELDSGPVLIVQSQEGLTQPESGSALATDTTPCETKVLNAADKMGPLGHGKNSKLQGCAENGVHHLAGSTDAVIASAAN